MSEKNARKKNGRGTVKPEAISTTEFDREFIADSFKPLSPADKARWERARARGNGPHGTEPAVTIHVEASLLDHVDSLAQRLGVSRECLITRGIKAVLAAAGES